ncbi:MAG: NAD(P)(+) transhydrogenase (Re/Si-specific) subunit beta, partial [Acidobacteria bacterium]|nr:NAD(P)(+) transhydrogenase (Re/Si-specific) subunit beta [Acidobacteriota bacterium]
MYKTYFIEITYLAASILFILGLKGLSHPESAKRGMHLAEFGMLMAIIGTLLHREIVSYEWIIAGLVVGGGIGAAMAYWVPMTAMPQRTALSHAFGAFAAALVGISEYYRHSVDPSVPLEGFKMTALSFEVMLGALTTTGSLIAFAKLQGMVRGTPMTFKGQNVFNMLLLAVMLGLFVYLLFVPTAEWAFYTMMGLSFLFGVMLVIPIGAADMPVVMSLLNSYAGLAAAATGFALSNNVLIIAGTLDGFSGFILSVLMCRAMNRSMTNVLFGAFGSETSTALAEGEMGVMREVSPEDVAVQLAYARQVVFVPGYGMATAQAQYAVRELANTLEERGVSVK